ncbi:MAG: hypothetical protein M3P83_07280, partial [Actinomycetota bacterium]|nr:hypothetical protein [Actinomycetota bacterium]
GTAASVAAVLGQPSYAWRGGRLRTERPAARVGRLRAGGRTLTGVSVGGAEHLFLPASHPRLRDVEVLLGWAGRRSRTVQVGSALATPLLRLPGSRRKLDAMTRRFVRGSTGGPSPEDRTKVTTLVVAEVYDAQRLSARQHSLRSGGVLTARGRLLSRAEVTGPNPYDLTARLLAGAAKRLFADRSTAPTGVVGPVQLLDEDGLLDLGDEVGLRRVEPGQRTRP